MAMSMMSGTSNQFAHNPAMMRNSMFFNNAGAIPDQMGRYSMGLAMNQTSTVMNPMQFNTMPFQQLQHPMIGMQQNRQMSAYFPNSSGMDMVAGDDDDVALSNFANPGRPGAADNHPLRAAMGSHMSASTPHLLGQMPQSKFKQRTNSIPMLAQGQQTRDSMMVNQAGGSRLPSTSSAGNLGHLNDYRSSTNFNILPLGQQEQVITSGQPRNSYMSSGSGSGHSSSTSSLQTPQNRHIAGQSKWVKKQEADNGFSSNGRYSAASAADSVTDSPFLASQPKKSYSRSREQSTSTSPKSTAKPSTRLNNSYEAAGKSNMRNASTRLASNNYLSGDDEEDSDNDNPYLNDDDDSITSDKLENEYPMSIPKTMARHFELFVEHCIDIKPYTSVSHTKVFKAYSSFCSSNGTKAIDIGSSKQLIKMMECADWKLDKSSKDGGAQYRDICLL